MKPIISTTNLSKSYSIGKQRIDILNNITFDIKPGEFVALMGPSGSGKSTLMNIIGCLDAVDDGKYYLDGQDVANKSEDQLADIRNQKIGFVFQTFNLLPKLTALENVTLPSLYGKEDLTAVAKALMRKVGLADRFDHKPNELSGGQRQRVAIARSLLMNPPIILADEPTGNLDSKSGSDVMKIFQSLSNDGKTIVMVTHDANIASFAQRTIHLKDGSIVL
ncbi:MAG: ABC transporter ATP-binding protein [Candidatus Saccharibacteria bacterium]